MHDVEAIRAAHPIAETVAAAGIALRRAGRRLVAPCPFHTDRDPSFAVYPETDSWFCYGCNAGGDVIDFVGRLRGTPFRETASALSAGLVTLPANVSRLPSRARPREIDAEARALIEATVAYYERSLTAYADARAYLARRGVTLETARRLRLGYAGSGLADELRRRQLSLDAAQRLGLLTGERDTLCGRIVVPDLDAGRRATWLTGRALAGRGPRYLNLRAPSPLLGLTRARLIGPEAVVVVEGPFDWLTASEWAIPAVALLGTHVSRSAVGALRSFRSVFIALDTDAPGMRAGAELASALGPRAARVTLPTGVHDLNELGQRRDGHDAFLRALAGARTRKGRTWQQQSDPARPSRAA